MSSEELGEVCPYKRSFKNIFIDNFLHQNLINKYFYEKISA
jgi:hypothetical protein